MYGDLGTEYIQSSNPMYSPLMLQYFARLSCDMCGITPLEVFAI